MDLDETAAALEKKIGHKPSHDEVLSYLMYPDVFVKFAARAPELRRRGRAADAAVLTTAWSAARRSRWRLEPGKALVIKFLTVGEPHPDGTRTVFFELNGQPREVTVRDRSLEVKEPARAKADPAQAGPDRRADSGRGLDRRGGAESDRSKKGDRLLVMEAMKMQSTVYAPVAGKVTQLLVQPGEHVEAKDLLLVIE